MNTLRANIVPPYLLQATKDMIEGERRERMASIDKSQGEMVKSGRVAMRWARSNMDLIHHGFGVHEDRRTGAIWSVEGEELIRQDSDEDIEAIIASITTTTAAKKD